MSKRNVAARGGVLAAILAAALSAGPATPVLADEPCGEEGTWQGLADNGFAWMNTITRGSDITNGQLDLTWTAVDPTLGGAFSSAVGVTPGRGVWQKVSRQSVNRQTVRWTWIAYGLDVHGAQVYAIRANGTHAMPDCDHLGIVYVLEVFLPDQDMDTDPPVACMNGTALETRMHLAQSSCGQ